MTQQYMLLFSLGPVQTFIAQARKTRDLWIGSLLLSKLMEAAMKGIDDKAFVFPAERKVEANIPDLPNKYIAIFDTAEEAEAVAKNSEQRIKDFWQDICNYAWGAAFPRIKPSQETQDQWNKQIDPANVFEIFWVVVPRDNANYADWLSCTQSVFDGRKRLRNFQQQEEEGEKSSISGLRSALRGEKKSRSDVQNFWKDIAKEHSARDISKDGGERLDAIDTVKRFAFGFKNLVQQRDEEDKKLNAGYPSTSSIATASYVERLIAASEHPTVAKATKVWMKKAEKLGETMPITIPFLGELAKKYPQGNDILRNDGDCYFPETFSARRLQKEFGLSDTGEREELAKSGSEAVSKLLRATDALTPPITRPTPYYALIMMDGDKMGTIINEVHKQEEHTQINKALSEFSRKCVPSIVEGQYPGRLIYAGGDDVMALAPLTRDLQDATSIETVLDLVNEIQKQYREIVQASVIDKPPQPANGDGKRAPTRKESVTTSAGIAIAHHYTSLSYVRQVAKGSEERAKKFYGRNALVITVLRRSGEQTRVGCRWYYPHPDTEKQTQFIYPIPLFRSFYDLFKQDILSPKCVFNLLEEAPTLVKLDQDAQKSEIKRVLRRQRNQALEDKLTEEELKAKASDLVELAWAMDKAMDEYELYKTGKIGSSSVELHSSGRRYGLVEVLGWLLVMTFLARKEQE